MIFSYKCKHNLLKGIILLMNRGKPTNQSKAKDKAPDPPSKQPIRIITRKQDPSKPGRKQSDHNSGVVIPEH